MDDFDWPHNQLYMGYCTKKKNMAFKQISSIFIPNIPLRRMDNLKAAKNKHRLKLTIFLNSFNDIHVS
jgi:hypothetical protein